MSGSHFSKSRKTIGFENARPWCLNFRKKNVWKNDILFLSFKNPRKLLALFSSKIFFKKPNNLIAVTGTNGKSSIANFYFQIANLNKVKAASIGTLGINGLKIKKNFSNTTFDTIQINNILQKLKQKKIKYLLVIWSQISINQERYLMKLV